MEKSDLLRCTPVTLADGRKAIDLCAAGRGLFLQCGLGAWYAGTLILMSARVAAGADLDGAALYKQHCAACHDASSATRAPGPSSLWAMSPENIIRALESGLMQGPGLH